MSTDTDYGDFLDMLGKHEPFSAANDDAATRALYLLMQNGLAITRHTYTDELGCQVSIIADHLANHMDAYNHKTESELAELQAATRGDLKRQMKKDGDL